jgi:hypothetical protein
VAWLEGLAASDLHGRGWRDRGRGRPRHGGDN